MRKQEITGKNRERIGVKNVFFRFKAGADKQRKMRVLNIKFIAAECD